MERGLPIVPSIRIRKLIPVAVSNYQREACSIRTLNTTRYCLKHTQEHSKENLQPARPPSWILVCFRETGDSKERFTSCKCHVLFQILVSLDGLDDIT